MNKKIEATTPEVKTFPAEQVWAAAAAAYRLNGNKYLKITTGKLSPNKHFMKKLLFRPERILPQDYALAKEVRDYFQVDVFHRVIKGTILQSFLTEAFAATQAESITQSDANWNIIASLPNVFTNESKVAKWIEESEEYINNSTPYGTPGSEVSLAVKVLNSRYYKRYNNFAINAISEHGNLFFWFQHVPLEEGTTIQVTATVKTHYNGKTTQLYGVKVMKEKGCQS